jgi:hypothetical protein
MQPSEAAAMITVILTLATGATLIVRMLLDHLRRTRSERLQAELYDKMLDKFGSSADLLAYLETDAGRSLLRAAPAEKPAPHGRILNSIQAGIVLSAIAVPFLALRGMFEGEGREAFTVFGSLGLAAGLGLIVSGGVAWVLSKHLGLMKEAAPEQ